MLFFKLKLIKIRPFTFFILLSMIFLVIYFFRLLQNKQTERSKIVINGKTIYVEIADTEEKRTKGLSNHKPLQENEGMLFIFKTPDYYGFWMKNMTFDLDFIWINNYKVVDLTKNVSHRNQNAIYIPSNPANMVLEVNAGFILKNNIHINDKIEIELGQN